MPGAKDEPPVARYAIRAFDGDKPFLWALAYTSKAAKAMSIEAEKATGKRATVVDLEASR